MNIYFCVEIRKKMVILMQLWQMYHHVHTDSNNVCVMCVMSVNV